jgi:hypothetical protein
MGVFNKMRIMSTDYPHPVDVRKSRNELCTSENTNIISKYRADCNGIFMVIHNVDSCVFFVFHTGWTCAKLVDK